jgi:hypothetical protein
MTWKWMLTALASVAMAVTPAANAAAPTLTKKRAAKLFHHELNAREYTITVDDVFTDCHRLTTKRYKCSATWFTAADKEYEAHGYVIRYSRGTDVKVSVPRCISYCDG